jgi:UDP-N-acetylmuramyl pentapeptide phosphotransferase/UDP-N-acetylglucosamine-1-phosphate transferase
MNSLLIIISSAFFCILLNFFFMQKNFLVDKKILPHKSFASKNLVPLTGGFIIILNLLILNYSYLSFFFLAIFFLGVMSDLFLIKSALKKFLIQFFIVFLFLYFMDLKILYTKIIFLDYLLKYKLFALLFTCFCLLVLINGTNFLDGVNTLVCGYYILILLSIIYIGQKDRLFYNFNDYYFLLSSLIVVYFFNAFSKLYLGDSGSFLISFTVGYYLINLFNNNAHLAKSISPAFIVLLLWYPAFEILFSIIRKMLKKTHPSKPDNFHLHHLFFFFLQKRIKINKNFLNTLVANIINLYNLLIFILGLKFYFFTKYLIFIVFVNILLYLVAYFFLKSKDRINV